MIWTLNIQQTVRVVRLATMSRKLHNVPSNEIRSAWIHARSASLSWKSLFLIHCEDGALYFFKAWEADSILHIPLKEIKDVVDCEVMNPGRKETQLVVESYLAPDDRPCKGKLSKAFKANEIRFESSILSSAPNSF